MATFSFLKQAHTQQIVNIKYLFAFKQERKKISSVRYFRVETKIDVDAVFTVLFIYQICNCDLDRAHDHYPLWLNKQL